MAYASQSDAVELYGESYVLTSVDRDEDGSIDVDALSDALAQASSEMDSYLAVKHDVPITISPTPAVLIRRCVDIAIYICSPEAGTLTEEKIERYKMAIKWLEAIASGKAVIPGTEDGSSIGQGNTTAFRSEPRLFTRCKMKGIL